MFDYVNLVVLILLLKIGHSAASLRSYNFTIHSGFRAPGRSPHPYTNLPVKHGHRPFPEKLVDKRTDGFSREVYLINNQQPGPLIEVEEGDDLEIFVKNDLTVETTIHWHGMSPCLCLEPDYTQHMRTELRHYI